MAGSRPLLPWLIAIGSGVALWSATAVLGDRREPWDAPLFWSASYPLALLLCGLCGFAFPVRPWRWAVGLITSQLLIMIGSGADLSLLPLGLVMIGLLCLPAALASRIGASLRNRIGS